MALKSPKKVTELAEIKENKKLQEIINAAPLKSGKLQNKNDRVKITLSMTVEEREMIKVVAERKGFTASAMVAAVFEALHGRDLDGVKYLMDYKGR